jgi:hypothetical protein
MRVYRAYLTDEGGRFSGVKFLNCDSDEDALRKAEQFADYSPVHVWDRDRFVQTVQRHKRGGLFARFMQRRDRGRPA